MNVLTQIIGEEIQKRGAITFARFMEMALYCPDYGYYETENETVGRAGDFYTSVSVGPLFGELLAFQFADWLTRIPGEKVQIVEAGAHDGKLALDVLHWLRRFRPEVYKRLNYLLIEPSPRRQSWQKRTLVDHHDKVQWLPTFPKHDRERIRGVIFSNELLDAMPVHRLFWDATLRDWFEWGVSAGVNGFEQIRMGKTICPRELDDLPEELLNVLPDRFVFEISPAAKKWWQDAALSLETGFLLALDYGSFNEFGIDSKSSIGTVRAYRKHKVAEDVLKAVGEQDITAHVDFCAIQSAGERAGLETEMFETQSKFLLGIAGRFMKHWPGTGGLTPERSRELQTLTHPEFLGRAFSVLVQSRFSGAYGHQVGSIA